MHAVNKGYLLLVEPLLTAGADPNVRAPDGATALFMTAVHGHTDIIAMLMKAGASVSVRGPKGKTAVEVARKRYGEPNEARANDEPPELLALLDGRTWAEVQEETRRKADADAWEHAQRLETAAAYAEYAESNPQGRHVGEARRREAALRAKEDRRERLARKWPRGRKLRDCEICPEMVVVPAGKFRMGSPSHEAGRNDDEGPVHDVTIWEPFAVGIHEVTREEFRHFVKETGRSTPKKCRTYRSGEWKERSGRSWKKPEEAGVQAGQASSGGVRELGRREGVRGVAVQEDGRVVSVAERVGVGIRGASGNEDVAALGSGRGGSVPVRERSGQEIGEAIQQVEVGDCFV